MSKRNSDVGFAEDVIKIIFLFIVWVLPPLFVYGACIAFNLFLSSIPYALFYEKWDLFVLFESMLNFAENRFIPEVASEFSVMWLIIGICLFYLFMVFLQKQNIPRRKPWLCMYGVSVLIQLFMVFLEIFEHGEKVMVSSVNLIVWLSIVSGTFLMRVVYFEQLVFYFMNDTTKGTHGSAKFSNNNTELLNEKNDGLIIDGNRRLTLKDSLQNCLVVAPTGSGKTQSYILPNVLNPKGYSMVITDPSGEIFQKTSKRLSDAGYDVQVIQPYKLSQSNYYNPLENVETLSDAKIVAKTLVNQVASKGDPYWHIAASNLIATIIMLLKDLSTMDKRYKNLVNVKKFLAYPDEKIKELVVGFGSEVTKEEYSQISTGDEKAKNNVKSTALSSIELYSEENYRKLTSSHSINFRDLKDKSTALFVIIPEEKIKPSSSFLSVFYKQLFEYLLSHDKGNPVFVLLEEFANTGHIPDFSQIITVARKRNISISLVIQEIEQIEKLYPGCLEAIISGGCQNKLFYSGLGLKTSQYVSSLLGDTTISVKSKSRNPDWDGETTSYSNTNRRLMTHDEVRRIGKEQAIFVSGNHNPVFCNVMPAYKNKGIQRVLSECEGRVASINNGDVRETKFVETVFA